jgi:O-antigen chain-terminating methyltransferase
MAGASREGSKADAAGGRPGWARTLYRLTPWGLRRVVDGQTEAIAALAAGLDGAAERFLAVERRLDSVEEAIRGLQRELAALRDDRLVQVDIRFDGLEASLRETQNALTEVSATGARVRDELVPAVVDRGNLLIDRLAGELDELASLVERMLLDEPLPAPAAGEAERGIAAALREVQPRLLEAFRGDEAEIRHRLDRHLPVLRDAAPVLDLGCGRGELLLLLREAGIAASGVDSDPALVQAARRRGLEVSEGDALGALQALPAGSVGAVTAIHLLEHLAADALLRLLGEVRRVLRPGGILLAECPNPHTLRVGSGEFWIDPTHHRPLPPETLRLLATASGLAVECVEFLHPFPAEQRLAEAAPGRAGAASPEMAALSGRIDRLTGRLDELLNGPRDFVLVARRPTAD